jgi:hypothetical protein
MMSIATTRKSVHFDILVIPKAATMELQQSVHFDILNQKRRQWSCSSRLRPDCSRDGFAGKDRSRNKGPMLVKKMWGGYRKTQEPENRFFVVSSQPDEVRPNV